MTSKLSFDFARRKGKSCSFVPSSWYWDRLSNIFDYSSKENKTRCFAEYILFLEILFQHCKVDTSDDIDDLIAKFLEGGLVEKKYVIDFNVKIDSDNILFYLAKQGGYYLEEDHENVTYLELILREGINPNEQDKYGNTFMHYLLANLRLRETYDEYIVLINVFVKHGGNIEIKNNAGQTPLNRSLLKLIK